ncbi:hypothetical protein [Aeribacillus alveayuensis]|uniref:NarG-like domain-containing protein n=1 Tax=Aeribacillus alveayuensis TaxID=279215 RepID=A0ABT9VK76_9BACI|nr:hypothetical protein [Bacillus alveayuensis]
MFIHIYEGLQWLVGFSVYVILPFYVYRKVQKRKKVSLAWTVEKLW